MEASPARTWTAAGTSRHVARRFMARYPAVYLPLMRRRQPQSTVGPDTQVVIDGFTRSASTFAVIAFQLAQNDHVRLAHHLHAPAQLLAATRAGLPTMMPIRPPRDTVLSAAIREPTVPISQWLRSYAEFYERVEPSLGSMVVVTFETVTTDVGGSIDRLNERFGTSFARFDDSADNVEAVFEIIEERARRPAWQHLLGEFLAGRLSWDEYRHATKDRADRHTGSRSARAPGAAALGGTRARQAGTECAVRERPARARPTCGRERLRARGSRRSLSTALAAVGQWQLAVPLSL